MCHVLFRTFQLAMTLRGLRRWGSSPLRTSLAKMPWSSWVCNAQAQSGRPRHSATVAGCGVCLGLGLLWFMVQRLSNPKNSWQIQRSSFCLTASGFVARLQRSQKSLAILDWKADSIHQPESGTVAVKAQTSASQSLASRQ